jgi:hypothetical protein
MITVFGRVIKNVEKPLRLTNEDFRKFFVEYEANELIKQRERELMFKGFAEEISSTIKSKL